MIEETLNKALDYTRGNNTYLQCVNNNLEHAALAVRNMESGLRGDFQDLRSDFQTAAVGLYNQGQEIRNDIQASTAMNINAIQGMAMGITSDIRESTYAVVASQQMLAKTFNQGFSSVNNTINLGFGLVGNKIDVLSEEVSSKLDEIQDILNNPRLTQSRELYREALRSYKRGFYEEALEDCLGAIEKNKTDYISWYLLGLIYLYGAGENSNVINLDKAEEAFANAAKYIKPDIPKSNEAKLLASDIYYNLGFSRLAKSNDYLIENKVDDSNTKLLEAEEASRTSYQLSKENLLARYEHAKSLHFLGKDDEVLKILEELIRKEKNFAIKSMNDENFKSLWSCIEKLIEKLKLEVCNQIKNKIKETIDFYEKKLKANDEIANYELPRNYRTSNIEVFQKKQNELKLRYADIENNDYFTVLNLKKQLSGDLDNFSNEISNLIHDTKTAIEQKLAEERRIQQAEREREQAELRRQREERERQEREERRRKEKEEERRRKNELLQRLEELERTLPSPDKLSELSYFLERTWLDNDFCNFVRNRTGKYSYSHEWAHKFKNIHNSIDDLKKSIDTISEQEIKEKCEDIEEIPIFLELKRDWIKRFRKQDRIKILRIVCIFFWPIIGIIAGIINCNMPHFSKPDLTDKLDFLFLFWELVVMFTSGHKAIVEGSGFWGTVGKILLGVFLGYFWFCLVFYCVGELFTSASFICILVSTIMGIYVARIKFAIYSAEL